MNNCCVLNLRKEANDIKQIKFNHYQNTGLSFIVSHHIAESLNPPG
jgi:hypothetical protein